MNAPLKQHLIDPEICIRCYTCEATCPIEAITHNDDNVVVDAKICNQCMDCIPVCPTGSIDNWRVVNTPFTLDVQYSWEELPEQEALEAAAGEPEATVEALDDDVASLLTDAHSGAGGATRAPATASKPVVNLYPPSRPVVARVQGNYQLTENTDDNDVRHIILDLGEHRFPVLEGQSLGIIAPGTRDNGKPHLPRLYSVSSPRDGERSNFNNLSLTVKREADGVCSNYLCDLEKGDEVEVTGPFGATFLLPSDPKAQLLLICTGTGSAPFRAFTMHRSRVTVNHEKPMLMFFGARTPETLPYFGPLKKVPESLLQQHLVFSRLQDQPKRYVQDEMMDNATKILDVLSNENGYVYICGLRAMEDGVNQALERISNDAGKDWLALRDHMRSEGRYHVETY